MMIFLTVGFFVLTIIGVPVAFAMGLVGATWILFFEGLEPTILARRTYFALGSFPLLSIPLFIMLGFLAERTRNAAAARYLAAHDVRADAQRHGTSQRRLFGVVLGRQRHRCVRHRKPGPHSDSAHDARRLSGRPMQRH